MIGGVRYVAVVIAAITLVVPTAATVVGPGVRNGHAMVFDGRRGVTVTFGGADASRVRDDTWSWDGKRWRLEPWRGPGPRTFPAIAWDAAGGVCCSEKKPIATRFSATRGCSDGTGGGCSRSVVRQSAPKPRPRTTPR